MMNVILAHAVIFLTSNSILAKESDDVAEAFIEAGIVPDIIPTAPPNLLIAKHKKAEVNLGKFIFPTKTIGEPKLKMKVNSTSYYTLVIFDADAPSPKSPYLAAYLMNVYVNVVNLKLVEHLVLVPYVPASPVPATGLHRFILLLYRQRKFIDTTDPYLSNLKSNRLHFSAVAFANRFNLELVGGNFYHSELHADLDYFCDV